MKKKEKLAEGWCKLLLKGCLGKCLAKYKKEVMKPPDSPLERSEKDTVLPKRNSGRKT